MYVYFVLTYGIGYSGIMKIHELSFAGAPIPTREVMVATRAAARMIHLRMYFHPAHLGGWSPRVICAGLGDWTLRSVRCPALSSIRHAGEPRLRECCGMERVRAIWGEAILLKQENKNIWLDSEE